jgi:hypothetical protein
MADIVLMHGIGQEQKVADILEEEWLPALAGGVRLAGFPFITNKTNNPFPDWGPGWITLLYAKVNNFFCALAVCLSKLSALKPVQQPAASELRRKPTSS